MESCSPHQAECGHCDGNLKRMDTFGLGCSTNACVTHTYSKSELEVNEYGNLKGDREDGGSKDHRPERGAAEEGSEDSKGDRKGRGVAEEETNGKLIVTECGGTRRGGKRGGWKRANGAEKVRKREEARRAAARGSGGPGDEGSGDSSEGDQEEDEDDEPPRPKKSREAEEEAARASPARIFVPQRGDRWLEVSWLELKEANLDAYGVKRALRESATLANDDLRLDHMYLFEYTEDHESAGAYGPPLGDEEIVQSGEQLILWITSRPPEEWVSWSPRWTRSQEMLSAPEATNRSSIRRVTRMMADRAASASCSRASSAPASGRAKPPEYAPGCTAEEAYRTKPTFGEVAAAAAASAPEERSSSVPPSSGGTSRSWGPLQRAEEQLADARARVVSTAVEMFGGGRAAVGALEIRCSELRARRTARLGREAQRALREQELRRVHGPALTREASVSPPRTAGRGESSGGRVAGALAASMQTLAIGGARSRSRNRGPQRGPAPKWQPRSTQVDSDTSGSEVVAPLRLTEASPRPRAARAWAKEKARPRTPGGSSSQPQPANRSPSRRCGGPELPPASYRPSEHPGLARESQPCERAGAPPERDVRSVGPEASPEAGHAEEPTAPSPGPRQSKPPQVTPAGDQPGAQEALEYLNWCLEHADFKPELVKPVTDLGNRLLLAAGSVEGAAARLREARERTLGNPLRGVLDASFGEAQEEDHRNYLREMATKGVPVRRLQPRQRTVAKPHASAKDHAEEMYAKAWKDTAYGVVLWATPEAEAALKASELVESPSGRVPKMLPDRTLSGEGRPIHDMRGANSDSPKELHPPALQPKHEALVRLSLWWSARHPGVPQVIAKRDVSRAFKWHWVRDEDVAEFGTSLPGEAVGMTTRVIIIHCVTVFGWSGSPGEYMSFAWAAKWDHERRRPPDPAVNDTVRWSSKWLMDDGVLVEPLVGLRPWLSAADCDASMRRVWGGEAINVEKMAEEGTFQPEQLVWGLFCDVARQLIRLPEPKCVKAAHLLAMAELRFGCRRVPIKIVQELRGSAQFWVATQPAIKPELPVIDRLLGGGLGAAWAEPKGTPEEVALAWDEWDQTLELLRVLFDAPEAWSSTFEASFISCLGPRERLALPGAAARTRWTGGDATKENIGSIDWGRSVAGNENEKPYYMAVEAAPLLSQLEDVLGHPSAEKDWIIAVVELLAFVALAAERGGQWRGELVYYVTDNQNVRTWLSKRRPRHPLARHMIRLVQRLEGPHGVCTTSPARGHRCCRLVALPDNSPSCTKLESPSCPRRTVSPQAYCSARSSDGSCPRKAGQSLPTWQTHPESSMLSKAGS